MLNDPSVRDKLYERLRRPPSPHTVPGSLPVLFFGDIDKTTIASVGINPSHREYLGPLEHELAGGARRFETLASLEATTRAELTDKRCEQAINTMRDYFKHDKTVYWSYFCSLDRVSTEMGYPYADGKVVSLNLVQEATNPIWGKQNKQVRDDLLDSDLQFLRWQLETFPLRIVVCNGTTPLKSVCGLLEPSMRVASIKRQGHVTDHTWYATRGQIAGRALTVVGWNRLLKYAAFLDQEKIGRQLRQAIDELGS